MNIRNQFKKLSLSMLIMGSVSSTLISVSEIALAQMPGRPMPGTPGGPRPGPQPQPRPQPDPQPRPGPQPYPPQPPPPRPQPPMPPPRPVPPPQPYPPQPYPPQPPPQPRPQPPMPPPRPVPPPQPYPPQPVPPPMPPPPPPQPYPPAPYPGPGLVRSSVIIPSVTRRSGGEWKQILLNPRVTIRNLELRPQFADLKVHEAQLVDMYGRTMPIYNLNGTMISRGMSAQAFSLDSFGPISAINLRVESFGAYADLEVTTLSDQFTQLTSRDLGPVPDPQPQPYPQPNPNDGSLAGFCEDRDHSQFNSAKDFAYSTDGLNMNSNDSVNWALNFNQTHACGTISEYASRFRALYDLAYRTDGLDMSSTAARAYANDKVEYVPLYQIQANLQIVIAIKAFAYNTDGLNFSSTQSQETARLWIDRGNCGDTNLISSMYDEYRRQYNFAYSTGGLNYSSTDARIYAVQQISNFSSCTDLFR